MSSSITQKHELAAHPNRPWKPLPSELLLLASVLLALFMAALEQTIVAPALPAIGRTLDNAHLLPWVATAYLLAVTIASPLFGALADSLGRRPSLYLALGLFLAGSLGAALAAHMPALIAARILQGAGAGGLVSLPFVVVADTVPIRERIRYGALISTLFAIASIGGPPVGGYITEFMHWRLGFWINLPIGAIVLLALILQPPAQQKLTPRRLDVTGALLLSATVASAILLIETITVPEASGPTMATLAAILLLGVIGLTRRLRRASNPLIPLRVLTEPTIRRCAIAFVGLHGANLGLTLFLPFYYQNQMGMTASDSGLALLGFVGGIAVGAYVPARVLSRNPRYKPVMLTAAAIAFGGALATMGSLALNGIPLIVIELTTIIMGLGLGGLYPTLMIVSQNAAGKSDIGATTGVLGFCRAFGGVIGVALTGMVATAIGLMGGPSLLPIWALAVVPGGMALLSLAALITLPSRALGDH